MKTQIVGRNVDLGESLREHIESSLEKLLKKYFDHATTYHVTLEKTEKKGLGVHTSIEIHIGQGIEVRADAENVDIHLSVDQAVRKAEHNLRRYKNRLKDHHKDQNHTREEKAMQYVLHSAYRNLDEEEEGEAHKQPSVIAETTAYIPTLSVSEAVMRMDIGGNSALLFRNKSHGDFNMVYLRKDGNIGWIDPKGNHKG